MAVRVFGVLLTTALAACGSGTSGGFDGQPVALCEGELERWGVARDAAGFELLASVAPGGRRALLLSRAGEAWLLRDAAWVMPPIAAASADAVLTCWNELVGHSEGDEGPAPTGGVALKCRLLNRGVLAPAFELPRAGAARWLTEVSSRADGSFAVRSLRDLTGTLETSADEPIAVVEADGTLTMRP